MDLSMNGYSNSPTKKYKRGDVIFKEGESAEGFYIIKKGKVSVIKRRKKRITPIYTAVEKEMLGEDCIFSNTFNYNYTAIALKPTEAIFIEKKLVESFLGDGRDWMKNLLELFANRLNHTSEVLAESHVRHDDLFANEEFSNSDEAFFKNILKSVES